MSMPYGDPPEMFVDSVFLVFCNRFVAVIFAVIMVFVKGEQFNNAAPIWKYLAISVSNVYASTCQYEALKYVSFSVQMLGKSFKMMPVMLWGMVVSDKRYTLMDWMIALAVTGGVTEFLMTGPITSSSSEDSNSYYGFLLLAAFLALDGFTSTMQEKLFKDHATTKYNQMLWVNLGSCAISSFTLVASGSLSNAVNFLYAYPAFAIDALTLSASAVCSQWFIYSQVKEFGALVFAATMNIRQIVSIIVSYVTYGNMITPMQIVGLAVVFLALFYKTYSSLSPTKSEARPLLPARAAPEARDAKV